jgi:formylglycine-generating enzyme required for sulfatase activity
MVQLVVETGGTQIRFLTAQLLSCNTGQLAGRGTYRRMTAPKGMANAVPEMVQVYGGVFEMGCKSGRDGTCETDETPLHWVRVNNFYIGKYEVTQALWKKVMGSLPSSISGSYLGDNKPVIYVTYADITGTNGFLAKLNALTGKKYRLPTEAEWEYAARECNGGICESFLYSGSNNIEDVGWYSSNCGGYPHSVGEKKSNALGIYDMTGNVWEYCSDLYSSTYYPSNTSQSSPQDNPTGPGGGSYRLSRGGSHVHNTSWHRVACRNDHSGTTIFDDLGFRLVLQ